MNPIVVAALQLSYQQIALNIQEVSANPNMTYSENGRSVSQTEYLAMLLDKQKTILEAIQMAEGPFEIRA
jgi:hypothetical protein